MVYRMGDKYALCFAEMDDIDSWMRLVALVGDGFPGLVIGDYRETLIRNIARQSAICVKHEGEIVGVLLYSLKHGCLSCMAVHPAHRRHGIASAMIERMIDRFPKDADISVSTFRKGDPKGIAPRALYKRFGFQEDALIVELGYPSQRFVLQRHR